MHRDCRRLSSTHASSSAVRGWISSPELLLRESLVGKSPSGYKIGLSEHSGASRMPSTEFRRDSLSCGFKYDWIPPRPW